MIAALAFLALGLTWVVWSRVIFSRVLIADFYKFRLDLKFEDDGTEVSAGNKPSNPLTRNLLT